MGNVYYLVSPKGQRVLCTDKRCPIVDRAVSFPVCMDPAQFARDFTPDLAIAAHAWVMHYGGPGMWVECDAAFSWEDKPGPLPDWTEWPEDDLFELRDWLFGD